MKSFRQIIAWVKRIPQAISDTPRGEILIFILVNFPISWVINGVLMYLFGHSVSVVLSTLVVVPVNYLIIKVYDSQRKELVGLSKMRNSQWWVKRERKFFFLTIIFIYDAKMYVIVKRPAEDDYRGMPGLQMKILFLISSVLINMGLNGIIYLLFSFWGHIKYIVFVFYYLGFLK